MADISPMNSAKFPVGCEVTDDSSDGSNEITSQVVSKRDHDESSSAMPHLPDTTSTPSEPIHQDEPNSTRRVATAADKDSGQLHMPGGENTQGGAQDNANGDQHGNADDSNKTVSLHLSEATPSGELTPRTSGFTSDAVDDEHISDNDLSVTPFTIPSSPNEPSHQAGGNWAEMLTNMLDDLMIGHIAPPPSPASLDPAVPNTPVLPTLSAFPSPAHSSPSTRSTLSPATRAAVPSRSESPPPRLEEDQAEALAALIQEPTVFSNEYFVVRRSSLAGLGAFAARDLRCGETILVEQPLLLTTHFSLLLDYYTLSEEARQEYLSLHGAEDGDSLTRIERIGRYNAFLLPDPPATSPRRGEPAPSARIAIFAVASRFNHACLPSPRRNVSYAVDGETGAIAMTVCAEGGAPRGEELLISYGGTPAELYAAYGFRCECGGCAGLTDEEVERMEEGWWGTWEG
ncbi:hypothetical protein VTJ49DRAFT_3747 [Mycothermus thermophilus]|uniref:SET domain-containing protein n=1 Tax=Humicola insolens TaxID=85995 RepID=A0ABR3V7B1_HUMIN